jgi:hypothetical protein
MPRALRLLVFFVALLVPALAFAQKPKPKPHGPKPKPTATATEAPPTPPVPTTTNAPTIPDDSAAKKEEARARFERGMALFEKKVWDAALAEFLQSRQFYPTRGNTQNAALCLKNLNRYDEALDMFETLVRDFPNLPAQDRALVDKEIAELRNLVGSLEIRCNEPGAAVVVDRRDRGVTQLTSPIRVSVGTHVVQVYKEGLTPFEKRVEVAGGRTVLVEAKLDPLTQSGRLTVTEENGKPAEVVIDNVVVGRAPWQGLFAIGDHTVFLRGEGNLGTQPALATVKINQVTKLTLALEPLEGKLRVTPTPVSATIAIDGVTVGNGVWDGKLRAGPHRVEIAAEGFLPQQRQVTLAEGRSELLQPQLERDPNSPLWAAQTPPKVVFELFGAPALAPGLGGDLNDACTGGCDKGTPFGVLASFHGGYQLRSGLGFGVDAGVFQMTQTLSGRPATLHPVGKPDNLGTVTDEIKVRGLTLGGAGFFHVGERFPFVARLGAGVLLGTATDRRSGQFAPPNDPAAGYAVDAVSESPSVAYFYVAPEVRIGVRFAGHVEVFTGVRALVLVGLQDARWKNQRSVVAGTQGLATYDEQSIVGKTALVVAPGLGVRYDF